MIKDYALFNHHEENDTLRILFSDEKYDTIKNVNNIDILIKNNSVVGYQIPNFIRYAKIKYSGIVFYPNKLLIDVINSVLENAKLETLSYKVSSGYIIKSNGDNLGVYAEEGTFLRDETISVGRFCTYFDLYIDSDEPNSLIKIDDKNLENKDFFGN